MENLVVISGCSGGDKSTLLDELGRRGHTIVAEPGRRIIAEQGVLPWVDPTAFAERTVKMSLKDRETANSTA